MVAFTLNGQPASADAEGDTPLLWVIREHLKLSRPIYARTAAYGHFGRTPNADGGFSWEKTDIADQLKSAFS